jgi:hypothetical protein
VPAGFVKSLGYAYLRNMLKAFEFCLPTNATKVPVGQNGSTKSSMTDFTSASSEAAIGWG